MSTKIQVQTLEKLVATDTRTLKALFKDSTTAQILNRLLGGRAENYTPNETTSFLVSGKDVRDHKNQIYPITLQEEIIRRGSGFIRAFCGALPQFQSFMNSPLLTSKYTEDQRLSLLDVHLTQPLFTTVIKQVNKLDHLGAVVAAHTDITDEACLVIQENIEMMTAIQRARDNIQVPRIGSFSLYTLDPSEFTNGNEGQRDMKIEATWSEIGFSDKQLNKLLPEVRQRLFGIPTSEDHTGEHGYILNGCNSIAVAQGGAMNIAANLLAPVLNASGLKTQWAILDARKVPGGTDVTTDAIRYQREVVMVERIMGRLEGSIQSMTASLHLDPVIKPSDIPVEWYKQATFTKAVNTANRLSDAAASALPPTDISAMLLAHADLQKFEVVVALIEVNQMIGLLSTLKGQLVVSKKELKVRRNELAIASRESGNLFISSLIDEEAFRRAYGAKGDGRFFNTAAPDMEAFNVIMAIAGSGGNQYTPTAKFKPSLMIAAVKDMFAIEESNIAIAREMAEGKTPSTVRSALTQVIYTDGIFDNKSTSREQNEFHQFDLTCSDVSSAPMVHDNLLTRKGGVDISYTDDHGKLCFDEVKIEDVPDNHDLNKTFKKVKGSIPNVRVTKELVQSIIDAECKGVVLEEKTSLSYNDFTLGARNNDSTRTYDTVNVGSTRLDCGDNLNHVECSVVSLVSRTWEDVAGEKYKLKEMDYTFECVASSAGFTSLLASILSKALGSYSVHLVREEKCTINNLAVPMAEIFSNVTKTSWTKPDNWEEDCALMSRLSGSDCYVVERGFTMAEAIKNKIKRSIFNKARSQMLTVSSMAMESALKIWDEKSAVNVQRSTIGKEFLKDIMAEYKGEKLQLVAYFKTLVHIESLRYLIHLGRSKKNQIGKVDADMVYAQHGLSNTSLSDLYAEEQPEDVLTQDWTTNLIQIELQK